MRPEDLAQATITSLSRAMDAGVLSPVDLTKAYLERIAHLDGRLRSYVTVLEEDALREATRAEAEMKRDGPRSALHGIPVAVKDNVQTAGVRTTCGSRIMATWAPTEDAEVIRRLKRAGAVLLGKLNMMEFAFRVAHPDFPPPRNPWDMTRSCAGSSSGSAAAVAASLCPGAFGTDTGGSIRIPASYCGIVGFKPTYDLVSRDGVVPLSWTLDHVGPMTKSVEDAAILLDAVAGPHRARAFAPDRQSFRSGLDRKLEAVRVGVPRQLRAGKLAQEVRTAFDGALEVLRGLGMTVREIDLPYVDEAPFVQRTIVFSEAAAYHQDFISARSADYSPRMREQIALGLALPAAQYVQAQRLRRLITREFMGKFREVDLLACPAAAVEATPLDQKSLIIDGEVLEEISPLTRLTNPFNVAGLPAISVPCGFSTSGLPLGFQIVGPLYGDGLVLAAAHAYERVTPWHLRSPRLEGLEEASDPPAEHV